MGSMDQTINWNGGQSQYFEGTIGSTVPAAGFPNGNYRINPSKYAYEGNWVFARFDHPDIYGARFGFGRGIFDGRDYGADQKNLSPIFFTHIELLRREGAVLWLCSDEFEAGDLVIDSASNEMSLEAGNRQIVRISGWPSMQWLLCSSDGDVAIDLKLDLKFATIIPDSILQHNRFAMWVAAGHVGGRIRYRDSVAQVEGFAFYDHPRINQIESSVPALGWFLYTPVRYSNNASLIAYYAQDQSGRPIGDYCFGQYVDPAGGSVWLRQIELKNLHFDADEKPSYWEQRFEGPNLAINMKSRTRPATLTRAWGGPTARPSLKENRNLPLVFDVEAEIGTERATGAGLGEYLDVSRNLWT